MRGSFALALGPLSLLALDAFALGVSGETLLPAGPAQVRPLSGFASAIAWDGTHYVALSADARDQVMQLYAYRLTPSGQSLDGSGIRVGQATQQVQSPSIACDGAGVCLIAWYADLSMPGPGLHARRLAGDGGLLDPAPVALPSSTAVADVRVIRGPSEFLVSWADSLGDGGTGVRAARMTSAGTLLDPAGVALEGPKVFDFVIAFDGAAYVLVWENSASYNFFTERFDSALNRIDAAPTQLIDGGNYESRLGDLSAQGGVSLLVWESDVLKLSSGIREVFAARLSNGAVLDPNGVRAYTCTSVCAAERATPVPGGFELTWKEGPFPSELPYVGRIDLDGGVLARTLIASPVRTQSPSIACRSNDCRALYDGTTGPFSIGVDSPTGTLDAGTEVTPAQVRAADQKSPSVACIGDVCLIAWAGYDSATEIGFDFATRVHGDGSAIDPAPFFVMDGGYAPGVVAGGGEFLVYDRVSIGTGPLQTMRVSTAGALLDGAPLKMGVLPLAQTAAWDGVAFRATWADPSGLNTALIAPGGGFVPPGPQSACASCSTQTYFLYMASVPDVTMAVVEGFMLPTSTLSFAPGGAALTSAPQPVGFYVPTGIVASTSPEQFLLTGLSSLPDGGESAAAIRVDLDGGTLDSAPILLPAPVINTPPGLAFDGTDYVVLLPVGTISNDIIGQRVTTQGALDGPPFDLATSNEHEVSPAVAATPQGLIAVYARYDPTPGVQAMRIAFRLLGDAGVVDAGTADAGTADAGAPDAGASAGSDAGSGGGFDAGSGSDGGLRAGSYSAGCGCTAGAGDLVCLALSLAGFARRRSPAGTRRSLRA